MTLPPNYHVLLIEDDPEEEKRLMHVMREVLPEEIRMRIHWQRRLRWGLRLLLDEQYPHKFSLIVAPANDDGNKLIGVMDVMDMDTSHVCLRDLHSDDILRQAVVATSTRSMAA